MHKLLELIISWYDHRIRRTWRQSPPRRRNWKCIRIHWGHERWWRVRNERCSCWRLVLNERRGRCWQIHCLVRKDRQINNPWSLCCDARETLLPFGSSLCRLRNRHRCNRNRCCEAWRLQQQRILHWNVRLIAAVWCELCSLSRRKRLSRKNRL